MHALAQFDVPQYVVLAGFAALLIVCVVGLANILRRGGWSALFGARIAETVGELHATGPFKAQSCVTVFIVERDSAERMIGVGCVSGSFRA